MQNSSLFTAQQALESVAVPGTIPVDNLILILGASFKDRIQDEESGWTLGYCLITLNLIQKYLFQSELSLKPNFIHLLICFC